MKKKLYIHSYIWLLISLILVLLVISLSFFPKKTLYFLDRQIINCKYSCEKGWTIKNHTCYQAAESLKKKAQYRCNDVSTKADVLNSVNNGR